MRFKTFINLLESNGFKPPAEVSKEAELGLEYRKKAGGEGGLTNKEASAEGIGSGVQRAINLKNRDNISLETIKRMKAFFDRHEKNKSVDPKFKDEPWRDNGKVAWLLWGGDSGRKWVNSILTESISNNFWYHGSSKKITELKPSQLLNLDYKTEDGVWLTDNKKQAMMYGANVSVWDTRDLKLRKEPNQNKQEFVVNSLVSQGMDKAEALDMMRKDKTFQDAYDIVYLKQVDQKGFDGIIFKGEFNNGYDLWINDIRALKKLKYIGEL